MIPNIFIPWIVLKERGIYTSNMNEDKMREVLRSHPDYKNEKSRIERLLTEEHGHIAYGMLQNKVTFKTVLLQS